VLDLDAALRGQAMPAAVEMRGEGDAVLVELAHLRQRHDLKAAAVGEDRARASA
jgi:hypothetical protein